MIYATEKKGVVITDIPLAYLTTAINEEVYMILEETMVEFIVLMTPVVYRTLVTVGKSGNKILYMKLKKDLDGSCNPNKCDICH